MTGQILFFGRVEKLLGAVWLTVALGMLIYAIWRFVGDDLDLKSFALLLAGAVLLLIMSSLVFFELTGRRTLALVMSLLVGFREYMLWAHSFPETIDIWVVRSALVLALAVVTFIFYLLPRATQKAP